MSKDDEISACVHCIHCDSLMISADLKNNKATVNYIHCGLFNDNKHPCYCCVRFVLRPETFEVSYGLCDKEP